MLRLASNICCLLALQLISLCLSQTPADTSAPTTTIAGKSDDFFVFTQLDLYVLLGVVIGCPILIVILCFWQRHKTRNAMKQRKLKTDKLMGNVIRKQSHKQKQQRMMKQQIQLQQQQQTRAHAQTVPHGPMGPMRQQQFKQSPARPISHTTAILPSDQGARKHAGSSDSSAPLISQSAPKSAVLDASNQGDVFQVFRPAPPPGPPPDDLLPLGKRKGKPAPSGNFMKSASNQQEKKEIQSALVLPDVGLDVIGSPPSAEPHAKHFDSMTGAPLNLLPLMVPLKSHESESATDVGPDLPEEVSIMDEEKADVETNVTHIGVNDAVARRDSGSSSSSSSSGEPIAHEVERLNLLKAHEQMATQPMPSLQSIFGRKVDQDESSDEDSLLQRQMQFGSTPDGPDGITDTVDTVDTPVADTNEHSLQIEIVQHKKSNSIILDV